MCTAIEAARAFDEVKDIRDKALAIQVYARQAKNTDAERHAAEIRVRVERKCGELLAEMPKAKGAAYEGNPGKGEPEDAWLHSVTAQTLAGMGISKRQSSEWQKLATLPEAQFEAAIAKQQVPTANGILSVHYSSESEEWYTPPEIIEREPTGNLPLVVLVAVERNRAPGLASLIAAVPRLSACAHFGGRDVDDAIRHAGSHLERAGLLLGRQPLLALLQALGTVVQSV